MASLISENWPRPTKDTGSKWPSDRSFVCPTVRLFVCPTVRLSVCPTVWLSVWQFDRLAVRPSVAMPEACLPNVWSPGELARAAREELGSCTVLYSTLQGGLGGGAGQAAAGYWYSQVWGSSKEEMSQSVGKRSTSEWTPNILLYGLLHTLSWVQIEHDSKKSLKKGLFLLRKNYRFNISEVIIELCPCVSW